MLYYNTHIFFPIILFFLYWFILSLHSLKKKIPYYEIGFFFLLAFYSNLLNVKRLYIDSAFSHAKSMVINLSSPQKKKLYWQYIKWRWKINLYSSTNLYIFIQVLACRLPCMSFKPQGTCFKLYNGYGEHCAWGHEKLNREYENYCANSFGKFNHCYDKLIYIRLRLPVMIKKFFISEDWKTWPHLRLSLSSQKIWLAQTWSSQTILASLIMMCHKIWHTRSMENILA